MTNSLGKANGIHSASDFLKLDNDFFFCNDGIKVDTVFFDSSTDKSRSKKLLTLVFGRLMEWRAKEWIRNYVIKNKDYLPGCENFLKSINSSGRVRRSDFMNLLVEARINQSQIFLQEQKNTFGINHNFLIENPDESLADYLSKLVRLPFSENSVRIFFDFIDRGNDALNAENIEAAVKFLDGFRVWYHEKNELSSLDFLKGRVNLFAAAVEERIAYIAGVSIVSLHEKLLKIKQQKNIKKEAAGSEEKLRRVKDSNEFSKKNMLQNFGNSARDLRNIISDGSTTPLLRDVQKFIEKIEQSEALDAAFATVKAINVSHPIVENFIKYSDMNRFSVLCFLDYIQSGSLVINSKNCDQLRQDKKDLIDNFLKKIEGDIDNHVYGCLKLVFDKFSSDVDCFASDNYARPVSLPGYLRSEK